MSRRGLQRVRTTGFGLIEIMIAMVLGLLLLLGLIQLFTSSKQGYRTQEGLGRLQENARYAIELIKRDIRMANGMGENYQRWTMRMSSARPVGTVNGECFVADGVTASFRWAVPVQPTALGVIPPKLYGSDNGRGPFTGCIPNGELQPNSDVLSLHYADPQSVVTPTASRIYLRNNVTGGVAFSCDDDDNPCFPSNEPPAGTIAPRNYQVISRAYYVRPWAVANNEADSLPTLVREELRGGSVSAEALVTGVQSMQVHYGVDIDNDGTVDQYQTATTVGGLVNNADLRNWNRVETVRIWLLLRSPESDPSRLGAADQTFTDPDGNTVTVPGQFMAQELSTTVAVRNPNTRSGGL